MNLRRPLGLLLAALLLSSCVVTQQDLQMQRDLLEMKRRLDEAERALKELKDDTSDTVRAHVETLAGNQAEFQAELDGLRVDLQSMQGRAGDRERRDTELRQDLELLRDELGLQLADHEARLTALESAAASAPVAVEAPPATPVADAPAAEAVPGQNVEASPVAEVSAEAPVLATPAPVAVTPAGESAPELYNRALELIRQERNFAEGRELMQTFLKRYPQDSLAVNAAYWIGETFYVEEAYDKAILQFQEIIEKYAEHPKVASAILKQALAFEALGENDNATLLQQQLIDRFPLSEEAAKARARLQSGGAQ